MEGRTPRLRPRLSRRERQTLLYTAAGGKRAEIAVALGVSEVTVRTYQERFTAKLSGVNVRHAVSRALLLGEWTLSDVDAAASQGGPGESCVLDCDDTTSVVPG